MRDRTPTKVLDNGAIRYAVYDEQGNFLRYEFIAPADDPTDEGTPLNKATLLTDETAMALGIGLGTGTGTLVNLLPNSSFENGDEGWSGGLTNYINENPDSTRARTGDRSLDFNNYGSSTSTTLYASVPYHPIYGHIYYMFFHARGFTSNWLNGSMSLGGSAWAFSERFAAEWKRVSCRYAAQSGDAPFNFNVTSANGNAVDDLLLVDLTETFGAGYEPTQEWCDENIPYFEGSYDISNPTVDEALSRLRHDTVVSPETADALGLDGDDPTVDEALRYAATIHLDNVYSEAEVTKASNPTALSQARAYLVATTVGNYALFCGGRLDASYSAVVDAYNSSLVRSTPTALSKARSDLAATTVGDYALFGGGVNSGRVNTVDAYNSSLVRSTPTVLSVVRNELAATTVGSYALFGGGYDTPSQESAVVDAYNSSLVRSTPTVLSVARAYLAATTVGNYALFCGGSYDTSKNRTVDAYNSSLVRSTPTALGVGRYNIGATTVGDYALFGGGANMNNTVDAYNSSLVRSTVTSLNVGKNKPAATTVGDYALFGGGGVADGGGSGSDVVDAYDSSLVHSTPTALSKGRWQLAATTVGDYALFGGGYASTYTGSIGNEVDAYTYLATRFTIPAWSKYKFDGHHTEEQFTTADLEWESAGTLSGYIKRGGFALSGKL